MLKISAFGNTQNVVGNAKTQRTAKLKEVQPTAQSQRFAPHLILLQRSSDYRAIVILNPILAITPFKIVTLQTEYKFELNISQWLKKRQKKI